MERGRRRPGENGRLVNGQWMEIIGFNFRARCGASCSAEICGGGEVGLVSPDKIGSFTRAFIMFVFSWF